MIFRLYFWILTKRIQKWLNKEFFQYDFTNFNLKDFLYFYCLWKNQKINKNTILKLFLE